MSKRKKRREPSPFAVGDDLGVDWSRWADGRARRVKRKRDYPDVEPAVARADIANAAKRLGKAVITTRDKYVPDKYVWVQFADHKVAPGDPCPCGNKRLLRLHVNFLRCPECHSQLLLSDEVEEDEGKESRAARQLRDLRDVHLERCGQTGDLQQFRGYAMKGETPVLAWVDFRLKPRESQIEERRIFERVVLVRTLPFQELSELFGSRSPDASTLWDGREPNWELEWVEPPELESAREMDEVID